MAVQAFRNLIPRGELLGAAALVIIGVALTVLAPAKQSVERVSAVGSIRDIARFHRSPQFPEERGCSICCRTRNRERFYEACYEDRSTANLR
jgi:hypothetical protein